jgi:predicted PurR-regulated permease PerM
MAIFRALAMLVALLLLLLVLWMVRSLVIVVFLAALLALPVGSGAEFLKRRLRVPRGLGVALIVLAVIGVLAGAGALLAPALSTQFSELREELPEAIDKFEAWLNSRPLIGGVVLGGEDVSAAAEAQQPAAPELTPGPPADDESSLSGRFASLLSRHAGALLPFVMSTAAAVTGVLLLLFLIIYLAANPSTYYRGMLRLVPVERRERTAEVLERVSSTLRQWLGAQFVSMIVIGVLTTVTMLLLDVRAAFAIGLLAGLLEFIPVFGPVIAAVPAIGIAFVDSPSKALYVLIAFAVIQQLEGNVVEPLVMKKGVDVPPVVTLLAGTVMTVLFGFLGLVVAVPIAAAALAIGRELTPPLEEGEEDG